jgi:hypothetical protein
LSPEKYAVIEFLLLEQQRKARNNRVKSLLRNLRVHEDISASGIIRGLQSTFVEQKFCYTSPDSAHRWYRFINDESYRQTLECTSALKVFLGEAPSSSNSTWTTFFHQPCVNGVVILGGGSPSKDELIIKSMLTIKRQSSCTLHYSLIDYSPWMAGETLSAIQDKLNTLDFDQEAKSKLILHDAIQADFEDLGDIEEDIRGEGVGHAWSILGGTFGNLDEEKFFGSIRRVAHVGDWLIVGVETVDNPVPDATKQAIKRKYGKNAEFVQFFREPLLAARNALPGSDVGRAGEVERALKRRQVELVDTGTYSKIPQGMSVIVTAKLDNQDRIILKSTRYDERSLIDYAKGFKFSFVKSVNLTGK